MKSKNALHFFLSLLLGLIVMTACSKSKDDVVVSNPFDDTGLMIESASNSLEESIDDQQGSSYALQKKSGFEFFVLSVLPEAYASACARPVTATCNAGVRSATLNDCAVGATGNLSGDITLTYSDAACSLATTGDTVEREFDLNYAGPRGYFKSRTTSDAANNYLGESFSGGGKISKTVAGWNVEILGRTRTATWKGTQILSHSVKTTSPIAITGSLARGTRVANGGEIVLSHNLAEYKAKIVPTNLTWSSSCCHPVAGSYAITYEGSITGSATLTFAGCGSAEYQKGTTTKDISLSYCH